jgi:hypothetical protein
MLKDLFHKETFAYFVQKFSTEDLIARARPGHKAARLFMFDLPGFVLFYVFVVIAKTVYRGGKIDVTDLVTPVFLYVLLLYVGGVLFFVFGLFNVQKDRMFDLFDKVIFILLLALAVFAADRFFAGFIFRNIDGAACYVVQRIGAECAHWEHKCLTSAAYGLISVLVLAANTLKRHGAALRARPELQLKVGVLVVIVVIPAFVLTTS